MILIDTNVIIDVLAKDPQWFDWSRNQILLGANRGEGFIDIIVIAEISRNYETLAQLHANIAPLSLQVADFGEDAAFVAGQVFSRYRKHRGDGAPSKVLPDFLIGAHALTLDASLLTRDPRFYKAYFPDLTLITPESHP